MSIDDLGHNLANEVIAHIDNNFESLDSIGRISFIGHSLGGLIIRSALRFLSDLKPKLQTYMTLSTPHLGYTQGGSKLVSTGIWFLKKWKKSKCLTQIAMQDKENFLYELSTHEGLSWFQNIFLLSSYQDSYAPYDSARIQQVTQKTGDRVQMFNKMANNLLGNLKINTLYRIDVNFKIKEKSMDSFIG